jgi:ABC-type nitrate/sulfonate/bicarbonate transport system substrate-binding protein
MMIAAEARAQIPLRSPFCKGGIFFDRFSPSLEKSGRGDLSSQGGGDYEANFRARRLDTRVHVIFVVTIIFSLLSTWASAADKLRLAYVSPSLTLSLPWVAKEAGILAKYDLTAEVVLITGSPRLVQSLIAGDVDVVFAGVTALIRARARGAEVAILGAAANLSSQKLMVSRSSKVRRLEDIRGVTIGVSQYGSEADTFARNALAKAGLKPDKDVTILQLGGHPQVAAAIAAGKLEAGVLGGLATLTAEKAGARVITSAVELKLLSPSGTFATTRGLIQRKRSVVERLMRSFRRSDSFAQDQSQRRDSIDAKVHGRLERGRGDVSLPGTGGPLGSFARAQR